MKKLVCISIIVSVLGGLAAAAAVSSRAPDPTVQRFEDGDIEFRDARAQAGEFIRYYHSITLTPEQKRTKEEALSAIPAPCCDSFSIATCCCPCNLAKAVWGLSHYLIAERHYDATRVRNAAEKWLQFTNPGGYSGNACHRGRCSASFEHDGCGGMSEDRIL